MKMPMPGYGGGAFVAAVPEVIESVTPDAACYWTRRKFSTPDGEVIRRVKVCETVDADQ